MAEKKKPEVMPEETPAVAQETPKKDPRPFEKGHVGTYKAIRLLNVRSEASTSADIVTVLNAGSEVECDGHFVKVEGVKWYNVSGNGFNGFCMGEFLSK